jgi:hypothetical protein
MGASEIKYDIPELNGKDEIFIFIDTDYNATTGYMSETIGADKLIQITGQYGIITDSTISNYNGIDNDWNWVSKVDTATANDYNEIEILGTDGNYYIHITSWNKDDDIVEAEIINKITLPSNSTGNDGNRAGTPSFPGSWTHIHNDADDGVSSEVEILDLYYAIDSDYVFFKIVTESNFISTTSTIGVIIDDVSIDTGTYEIACTTYKASNTNARGYVYSWNSAWELTHGSTNDYDDHIVINSGHSGVQLACDKDDLGFTLDEDNDKVRVVSTNDDSRQFRNDWEFENIPSTDRDDITDVTSIPEFSTIMMPVASVLLIVGNRIRNKKTSQQ